MEVIYFIVHEQTAHLRIANRRSALYRFNERTTAVRWREILKCKIPAMSDYLPAA